MSIDPGVFHNSSDRISDPSSSLSISAGLSSLLSSLAALPRPSSLDSEASYASTASRFSNPQVSLGSYSSNLYFPLPPWAGQGSQARRRSGSASARVANRASASFASLFGGRERERKGSQSSLPTSSNLESNSSAVPSSLGEPSTPKQSSTELPSVPTETANEATVSSKESAPPMTESPDPSAAASPQERTISIWVINSCISKRKVLDDLSTAVDARIRFALNGASLPSAVVESVSRLVTFVSRQFHRTIAR